MRVVADIIEVEDGVQLEKRLGLAASLNTLR